jgi:hypothetical protein
MGNKSKFRQIEGGHKKAPAVRRERGESEIPQGLVC